MKPTCLTILFFLYLSTNNALASETENRPLWFFSETSSLLNNSSHELATNHIQRGIRLVEKALKSELTPKEKFIAYYNLCKAHQMLKDTQTSTSACTRVNTLAQTTYNIEKIRGTLRLQRRNSQLVME